MAKKKVLTPDNVPVVALTVDTLVKLVERVGALERKNEALERALGEHRDAQAEWVPLVANGEITLFGIDDDGNRHEVSLPLPAPAGSAD